jgi:hypothetical protein
MALPGLFSNEDRRALERALLNVVSVRTWLDTAARAEPGSLDFRVAYARAARKLGPEGKRPLTTVVTGIANLREHWTLLDGARWLSGSQVLGRLDDASGAAFVHDLFLAGELGEQVSLLRTLPALAGAQRFLATAVEACRTNSVDVFEAITCENAYPAACFPELAYNQMVIKTIFLDLQVERIDGLDARITPELVRMAEGLGSERRAAGREVPPDIDYIVNRARQP